MEFKPPRNTVRTGPEAKGSARLQLYMRSKGWWCRKLHGGKYQSGLPDLVAMHSIHGIKWIETKAPKEKLRASQISIFKMFNRYGQRVYVLEDERDYWKLFDKKDNWLVYV